MNNDLINYLEKTTCNYKNHICDCWDTANSYEK